MKKDDNCIFCKIAAGEIPSKTLYEDEKFRVILDVGPASKGHALVIPKEHYPNLYELPAEEAAGAFLLAKEMITKMKDKLGCDGFNVLQNNGEAAGQTGLHFHVHLIPRYRQEAELFKYQPGKPDEKELEEIKKLITE